MKKRYNGRRWVHYRLLVSRITRGWPFLVWAGCAVLGYMLYVRSDRFAGLTGVVETLDEPVAPLETARLVELKVGLGQSVTQGQVVARMDSTLLDAQIAIDDTMLFEAGETVARYQQDVLDLVNSFEEAIRDANTGLLEEKQRQATTAAELFELRKESANREELFRKRLIDAQEVAALRPQIAALEASLAAFPELISSHQQRLEAARFSRKELNRWLRVGEGQSLSDAIEKKQEAQLAIFESTRELGLKKKEAYTLKATRNGLVSQVLHTPGNVVNAGDPIVQLVSPTSDRIIGFLPEQYGSALRTGTTGVVYRANGDFTGVRAIIASVSPEVRPLPGRIAPTQMQQLRGRRVVFQIVDPHTFLPGETVKIRDPGSFHLISDLINGLRRGSGREKKE